MEFTPAPDGLKSWLECAFWFVGFILALAALVRVLKGGTTKREVTISDDCVCQSEFDKYKRENKEDHDNLFRKIGGVERGARHELDNHKEVTNTILRNLPGEIIAILKNTGVIK